MIARPKPLPDPVTIATSPFNFIFVPRASRPCSVTTPPIPHPQTTESPSHTRPHPTPEKPPPRSLRAIPPTVPSESWPQTPCTFPDRPAAAESDPLQNS